MYYNEPISSPYYQMRNILPGNSRIIRFSAWRVRLLFTSAFTAIGAAVMGLVSSMLNFSINLGSFAFVPSENIIICVLLGALLGLIVGLIAGNSRVNQLNNLEALTENAFAEVRAALPVGNVLFDAQSAYMTVITPGRQVICESRVRVRDRYALEFFGELFPEKQGRLFLTTEALEFYDDDPVINANRNFLIHLQDIAYVRARGLFRTRVVVFSRSGRYDFRVPIGSAREWCVVIRHALQYGMRAFGPVHPRCM